MLTSETSSLLSLIAAGERYAVKIYYLHIRSISDSSNMSELCGKCLEAVMRGGKGCWDVAEEFIYHTDVLYYTMKGAIGVVGEEEGRSVKAWRRLITWGGKEVGKDWKVWVQGQDSKQDDDDDKDGSDSDSSSSPSPTSTSSSTPNHLSPRHYLRCRSKYLLHLTTLLPLPTTQPNVHLQLLTTLDAWMPKLNDLGVAFSPYLLTLSSSSNPSSVRVGCLAPLGHLVQATSLSSSDYYGYLSSCCAPCVFNEEGRRREWMEAYRRAVKSTHADTKRVREIIVKLAGIAGVVGVEGGEEAWEGVRQGLKGREGMEKSLMNEGSKGGGEIVRYVLGGGKHWYKGCRDRSREVKERKRKVFGEERKGRKAIKVVGEWEGKEVMRRTKKERREPWGLDGEDGEEEED